MLGGLGLGMVGAGMLANQFGSDPMKGFNRDLAGYQSQVMGGYQRTGDYTGPKTGNWIKDLINRSQGNRTFVPGRADPQAGPAAQAQTSGFRTNQADLISRLEALSKGQGPSLAAEQLRQATDRNMKQQASIAQTGRGNAALAGISASNAAGALGAQAASDSAVARIQEQQMALQQLGQNLQAGRSADQDLSQFNALQTNYRDQFNVEAQLRARGLNDEAIAKILGMKFASAQQAQSQSFGNQLMAGGAGLLAMNGSSMGGGGGRAAGMTMGMSPYGASGSMVPNGWQYNSQGQGFRV